MTKLLLLLTVFAVSCATKEKGETHPCQGMTAQECFRAALDLSDKGRKSEARDLYIYNCEVNKLGEACTNLGVFAINEKDFFDARLWFQMACDFGSGLGCAHRGCSFQCLPECGPCSVEVSSTKKALEFFKKGCEIGAPEGCYNAAIIYVQEKKDKKAKALFQEGCNLGMKTSCKE